MEDSTRMTKTPRLLTTRGTSDAFAQTLPASRRSVSAPKVSNLALEPSALAKT